MNKIKAKVRGSISILAITTVITASLAGGYYYVDHQADIQAQDTLSKLVDDAKAEGVNLSYSTVDASPLYRSVSISNFKIKGNEQEPDINLGNIEISGFNWQTLNQEKATLPPSMAIKIDNASLQLNPSMIQNDPDLQALVDTFGEKINFSTHFSYALDPETGLLSISSTDTMVDNFYFNTELSFGGADWLATFDVESAEKPLVGMMSTTLNTFSFTFKNQGIIEKIRAVAAKKTGRSQEQLTQESVNQIKQLQYVAEQNWGPLFVPMIDEVLKFTQQPQQLHVSINPEKALTSNDFMLAFMGGDAGLLALIKQAQIKVKAN